MKIVDENFEVITIDDVDLSKGYLTTTMMIREDAEPIDDITKFAWADEDYEEVQQYLLYREKTDEPTPEERIAALEEQLTAAKILLGVE